MRASGRTAPCRCEPRTRRGLAFAQLRGRESGLGQARVAHADLNLDDSVATNTRAHGKRQSMEDELEMSDLQTFGRDRDFAVGREPGLLETAPRADLASFVGTTRTGA